MKIVCAFDSFKGCMQRRIIEDATELKEAGFASVRSINESDNLPLEVLMQKDVAMENLKKTTNKIELGNQFINDTISFRNATIGDAFSCGKELK